MAGHWNAVAKVLEPFQYTVWTEFTPLANKFGAVNLGQGFPNFKCPDFVKQTLGAATHRDENQYSRVQGHPDLVNEIAATYKDKYNRQIDPLTEVVVTTGATEALCCAMLGLVDPGEEVIFFDPSFDLYIPQIAFARGVPVAVPLIPPSEGENAWQIDFEAFERAFNENTRVLILNTPQNPIGKVYTRAEYERIHDILVKWPKVAIINDEVYEYITYDGRILESLATYGNLWERSVTLSSAGKIFSVTGWKTGWGIGGAVVVRKIVMAHIWTTFCCNTVCQAALADVLRQARLPYEGFPTYYAWLNNEYSRKREILVNLLRSATKARITPVIPEGGFFVLGRIDPADITEPRFLENASPDFAFCRWSTEVLGVCAIPCSAFFLGPNKHIGERLVRYAICKSDEDFEAAASRLRD